MGIRLGHTFWWQLTPLQRALLKRIRREGLLERLSPWEGRTVRSLVARNLLRHRYRRGSGAGAWFLTRKGVDVLEKALSGAEALQKGDHTSGPQG